MPHHGLSRSRPTLPSTRHNIRHRRLNCPAVPKRAAAAEDENGAAISSLSVRPAIGSLSIRRSRPDGAAAGEHARFPGLTRPERAALGRFGESAPLYGRPRFGQETQMRPTHPGRSPAANPSQIRHHAPLNSDRVLCVQSFNQLFDGGLLGDVFNLLKNVVGQGNSFCRRAHLEFSVQCFRDVPHLNHLRHVNHMIACGAHAINGSPPAASATFPGSLRTNPRDTAGTAQSPA